MPVILRKYNRFSYFLLILTALWKVSQNSRRSFSPFPPIIRSFLLPSVLAHRLSLVNVSGAQEHWCYQKMVHMIRQ